jgi:hypothetical protein
MTPNLQRTGARAGFAASCRPVIAAPAKEFWSVVLYDPQTRSELQTSQPFRSKNSTRDKLITNDDGLADLCFGPAAPPGTEANWIAYGLG